MKFLFTLMIMCFHSSKLFLGGYIAVEFFFIVSGFLMVKSMTKTSENTGSLGKDTLSFVLHKAKSIFPFYLVAWCMSFVITQVLNNASLMESLVKLFRSPYNIFMLEMAGNYDMGHRIMGSWYISAMLLAMFFIYPIRKKNADFYDRVVAPIIVLLFIGYVYQQGKGISLTVSYISQLFIYNGLFRAIAEISLGCICYKLVERMTQVDFTVVGRIAISALEFLGYIVVFVMAYKTKRSDIDLVLLLILALSVSLTFSGKGIFSTLFNNRVFYFLGTFSLHIYLTHELVRKMIMPVVRKVNTIDKLIADSDIRYLAVFFCITACFALACFALGKLLQKSFPGIMRAVARITIKQ